MKTKDQNKIFVPHSSRFGISLLVPYPIRKVFPFRLSESEDISPQTLGKMSRIEA